MEPGSPSELGDAPFVNGLADEETAPPAAEPTAPSERSGVLFNQVAGEDETDADRMQKFVPDDVFPVNKPPRKRERADGPIAKRSRGGAETSKPSKKATVATAETAATAAGVAGTALNPCQLPRPPGEPSADLLDDRAVADVDEIYDDNERALSEFIRLHPMLSLDATSDRMLNKVADMIDQTSIPTKEVEVVTKTHDDLFLRPANVDNGERPCSNGDKCTCRWTAIFRHGENSERAFVCREYLLPSQYAEFCKSGELPKTPAKCLLCTRYYTTHIYTLARNSPSFCPSSAIQIQAFCNKLTCESPEADAPSHSSSIGAEDGYRASVMLFADEKWADTSSSRNSTSTLLWKPTVRFNCSDYEFVVDSDGVPRAIQVNMGIEQKDFGLPPCSSVESTEATLA